MDNKLSKTNKDFINKILESVDNELQKHNLNYKDEKYKISYDVSDNPRLYLGGCLISIFATNYKITNYYDYVIEKTIIYKELFYFRDDIDLLISQYVENMYISIIKCIEEREQRVER